MDGIGRSTEAGDDKRVVVLAAATSMGELDPAVLRAGRIELHIAIPAAGRDAVHAVLKLYTGRMPVEPAGLDAFLDDFATECTGLSAADVAGVCREAAMAALRQDIAAARVKPGHFREALAEWCHRAQATAL